jgi:amino acid transporter
MECALTPSGEVKDVARTVPRAIVLAMATATALYVALQLVAQGVLGPALASSEAPLAEAGAHLFGPAGRVLVVIGAGISMLGHVSGMTLSIPRAVFAFARDGFLPRAVAALHPRFHTPHVAIALQSAIACVLAVTSTFDRLAIFATTALLCLYGACCAAAWELRRRNVRAGGVPFQVPGGRFAPPAAGLAIAWMLTSVTAIEWAALLGVLAAASLVYVISTRARARRGDESAA